MWDWMDWLPTHSWRDCPRTQSIVTWRQIKTKPILGRDALHPGFPKLHLARKRGQSLPHSTAGMLQTYTRV